MTMLMQAEIQQLRSDHPELFAKLCEFNYLPAAYLHPTRRKNFFNGKLPEFVWSTRRVWPRLSMLILSELNLTEQAVFLPPRKKEIFAYLSLEEIERLAQQIGAILLGSKIRSCLARDEVLKWKQRLGEDLFEFVMNRSRLLPKIETGDIPKGIDDVEKIGYGLIAQCLNDLPFAVRERTFLKLKSEYISTRLDLRHANQLLQAVTTSLDTEWHSLFEETAT